MMTQAIKQFKMADLLLDWSRISDFNGNHSQFIDALALWGFTKSMIRTSYVKAVRSFFYNLK